MGQSDIIAKQYIQDNAVFADLFNYLLYDGSPTLKPEQLQSLDSSVTASLDKHNSNISLQRFRDIYKSCTAMTDGHAAYLLLGVEEQTDISYVMPVRAMLYDALAYDRQIRDMERKHRADKEHQGRSRGEYLSGWYKEDRLIPVITAILLLSPDKWDGPTQLHEMLTLEDPKLLSMVENYKIHLIAPSDITEENMKKFKTNLREVLSFIKYSRDKKQIQALVKGNPRFSAIDKNAAMVIRACTHYKFDIDSPEKEGDVNMGDALQDIYDEGLEVGRAAGLEAGRKDGFIKGQIALIINLMETMNLTADKAMELLKIPNTQQKEYISLIQGKVH
ncbi:MAG: transposase [Clostridiales bacterium]|nr:transposase [Clostridiales bacterium]